MDSVETGRSPFFSQLQKEGQRAADLVFTDLDTTSTTSNIEPGLFRASQINTLYGTLPLFVLSHIIVVPTFASVISEQFQTAMTVWWITLSIVPVALVFILWNHHAQRRSPVASVAEIRWVELLGILFGLSWALFPAAFFAPAGADLRVLIVGGTLAASAVGTFALSRVPAAAIIFCALITGSLSLSVIKLEGPIGLTSTLFTIAYGLILAGMVLNQHRDQLQKAVDAQEMHHQKDIIALLLNDFQLGTSDWLFECDANGSLTYVSTRLSEIVGKSPQNVKGLTLLDAAGADATQIGWTELYETMQQRKPIVAHRLEVNKAGQTAHWQISARPLFAEDDVFRGYRGVGRDVTAEWETDRKLIEAKEAAEAASAAKSQFLAVMSHELRTPLNSIVGFSEILSSRTEETLETEVRLDYAKTILNSSKHLQTLITDILDATRIENGTISLIEQDMDAAELVEIAVKMCRDQAEKTDVTLVAKLTDGIEIRADITRTKQVILNLLTNAIKFSLAGGVVNIELLRLRDDRLAIVIRDGGIGIKSEDVSRIFEPFVQAEDGMSRRFSGIGLGLSIARKIARLHGGEVTLESQFGVGTMARFELPPSRVTWPIMPSKPQPGVAA
ncbi:MAG TPA: ATP-binding protein [Aestuariivirga sp.]|nr:ATP-binding protein [Aestuariivirga sp.]